MNTNSREADYMWKYKMLKYKTKMRNQQGAASLPDMLSESLRLVKEIKAEPGSEDKLNRLSGLLEEKIPRFLSELK